MRPEPPDLPARLTPQPALDADGLFEARLADVSLPGTVTPAVRIDASVLERADLGGARLSAADLRGSDWEGTRLRLVAFVDCDLGDADLDGARFESVTMHGCRLAGLRGAAGLRGVSVRWQDVLDAAGTFATACGVRVQ